MRIVQHPSEARLQPGDILVAPTTDPGWTPLFLTLGGLITETGSTIAHGPTVAREYGIPAVVGAVLTPPDVLSQSMLAVPLMLLFELGLFVSKLALKMRRRREQSAGPPASPTP